MIYAAEILERRFVKVGYTEGLTSDARIATLQTGSPFKINPVLCINGTLRMEQTLHASLSAAFGRIRIPMPPNEWYPGRSPFFTEFLLYLGLGFDMALSFAEKYNSAVKQPSPRPGRSDVSPNIKWPKLKDSEIPSAGVWG